MRILMILVVTSLVSFSGCRGQDTTQAEAEAVESARAWLALVDEGAYAASWSEAAAYFRSAVTQQDWEQAAAAVRDPLGEVTSREVSSTMFATTLPGAPDGEYVVIQYNTGFANRSTAVETVTPMLDADGEWRVSGYYVK